MREKNCSGFLKNKIEKRGKDFLFIRRKIIFEKLICEKSKRQNFYSGKLFSIFF